MDLEGILLNVRNLKPGMDNVNVRVEVLSISKPQRITAGGAKHEILEAEVGDETGSITLVLWDDKIASMKIGDVLQIENGFVSSFKGNWRINVGKYGKIMKT